MTSKDIGMAEIAEIMCVHKSHLSKIISRNRHTFPKHSKVGGRTGKSYYYNREQFMSWLSGSKYKKVLDPVVKAPSKEIGTAAIADMMRIKKSALSRIINRKGSTFPKPVRVGGVTGTSFYYDEDEFIAWYDENKTEKVEEQSNKCVNLGHLMQDFITGKFDRECLQSRYRELAATAKERKPRTDRVFVTENYFDIIWPKQGL